MSTSPAEATIKKKVVNKKLDKSDELQPEDQKLKDDLTSYVEKIVSFNDEELTQAQLDEQKTAILAICTEMRQSTASMTAIPKPLKFLREHIPTLRRYYTKHVTGVDPTTAEVDALAPVSTDGIILPVDLDNASMDATERSKYTKPIKPWANQVYFADLLSILSMIIPNEQGLLLAYLFDAIQGDFNGCDLSMIHNWGISYVQALCSEVSQEYQRITYWENNTEDVDDDDSTSVDDDGNKKDNKNDTNSTIDEEEEDAEAAAASLQRSASMKPALASTPSLHANRSLQSNASSKTNESTDDKKKSSEVVDEDKKKTDESKALNTKKELSDAEKAKLEEEQLKSAKSKAKVSKPVTLATAEDLQTLSVRFLPHLFEHGCEIDAVDMLFETDNIIAMRSHIDERNCVDVLQYVENSNCFTDELEDQYRIYALLVNIYLGLKQYSSALTSALHITPYPAQKRALAEIFNVTRDIPHQQLSLAFMLSRYTSHCTYLCNDTWEEADERDLNQTDMVYTTVLSDLPIVIDPRAIEILQKGSCGSLDTQILNDLGVTKGKTVDDVCRVDDHEREDPYQWFAVGLANTGTKLAAVLEGKSGATKAATGAAIGSSSTANIALAKGLATGLIHIGDVEEGYSLVDPYLNPTTDEGNSNKAELKEQTIIGGIVATALCGAGVTNDFNAGAALLSDYLTDPQHSPAIRASTCLSLGLCYLNTQNGELRDLLLPLLLGEDLDVTGKGLCALSLGLIFLSSNDEIIAELLVATLDEVRTSTSAQRLVCLAFGLLIFNNQSIPESFSELFNNITLSAEIPGPNNTSSTLVEGLVEARIEALKEYLAVVLDICAHVGSCDMLLIQSLLRQLSTNDKLGRADDDDEEEDEDVGIFTPPAPATAATPPATPAVADKKTAQKNQKKVSMGADVATTKEKIQKDFDIRNMKRTTRALTTLAISFISLTDDLSKQCTMRLLGHLLECGSAETRSAIPLSIALLQVSQPSPAITDQLIRLTHDMSPELAINATLAIGITAAGSNNSRALAGISGMISDSNYNLVTQFGRIAQGLCMLGQGTLTLSTTCFNDSVLNIRSAVALFVIMSQMIEPDHGLCASLPIWSILPVCARPKVMIARLVDNDEPDVEPQTVQIPVKMGQVQGGMMLGRKTVLSGIQVTHTPVVIGVGSYVQLDDDDYSALSHCFEGTVLINKSPSAE